MDLKEAIYTRPAAREFTAEPVDERTLRQLINAAIQAPSAVNQQQWSFCVVRDKSSSIEYRTTPKHICCGPRKRRYHIISTRF